MATPERVGPFLVDRVLGRGGMGVVYLARREGQPDGPEVALKLVRSEFAADPDFRRRFAREVTAAMRVEGPHTAQVLAADLDASQPWMATEYVPGPTLAAEVSGSGPLQDGDVIAFSQHLSQALAAIHAAGMIHRDLKPSNVILSERGPVVVDFGISHALESTAITMSGLISGSPAWLSPEQLTGMPETSSLDMFAWACVVTFAATGRHPFGQGRPEALAYRVTHTDPDLTGVPEPLRSLVARCLDRDPSARPTSHDVAEAVAGFAGEAEPTALTSRSGAGSPLQPAAEEGPTTVVGRPGAAADADVTVLRPSAARSPEASSPRPSASTWPDEGSQGQSSPVAAVGRANGDRPRRGRKALIGVVSAVVVVLTSTALVALGLRSGSAPAAAGTSATPSPSASLTASPRPSATVTVTQAPDPPPKAPTAGQCSLSEIGWGGSQSEYLQEADCRRSHGVETMRVIPFTPTSATYGSTSMSSAASRAVKRQCGPDELNRYLGTTLSAETRFVVTYALPTFDEWDRGARWLRCGIVLRDGAKAQTVSGSLRGDLKGEVPLKYRRCVVPKKGIGQGDWRKCAGNRHVVYASATVRGKADRYRESTVKAKVSDYCGSFYRVSFSYTYTYWTPGNWAWKTGDPTNRGLAFCTVPLSTWRGFGSPDEKPRGSVRV